MQAIPEKEDLHSIFREDADGYMARGIYEDVTALSNADGGAVYVGIAPDGSRPGIAPGGAGLGAVAADIARHTMPPVSLAAELVGDEAPVLKISVPRSPDGLTATLDGRVLRRRLAADGTAENVPVYPCDIPPQTSRRRPADFTALPLPHATLQDFDPLHLERLRWTIETNPEERVMQDLTDSQLFAALGMVAPWDGRMVPTVTGLLLAGRFEALREHLPNAAMRFLVRKGTEIQIDEEDIMPIPAAIEKLRYAAHVWNPMHEMRLGLYRRQVPEFDEDAVLEGFVNAFTHRDYMRGGMVEIAITDEGLTVSNPGSLPEGIDSSNILVSPPFSPNPQLSRSLRRIGLKGSTKRGIDRIYEGSLQYGSALPQYFAPNPGTTALFLPRIRPDREVISLVTGYRSKFGHTLSIPALLVIHALREMPRARVYEVAEYTHLDQAIVRSAMGALIQQGIMEVHEGQSGRTYRLSPAASLPGQTEKETARRSVDSPNEVILDLAREKEYISNADVASLLGISSSRAYRLLKSLAEEGLLEPVNKGRYSKYRLRSRQS